MRACYTRRAAAELDAAYHWYERQDEGLGDRFLDEIEVALSRILDRPELFPCVRSDFRRCLIRRFPFSLIDTVETSRIVVHAVFDNRRDPGALP